MSYGKIKLFILFVFFACPVKAALNFAATGYVALDTNVSFIQTSTFTFATWVRLSANQTVRELITCAGVGTVTGYGMGIDDSTNNKFKFYTANNAGTSNNLVSASAIPINEWHHVAFVYSAVTSGTEKFIYIDGRLDASVATTVQIGYSGATCGLAIYRGAANQYLNGDMDDARFYPRKLTANEIRTLALGRVKTPCYKPDCGAYWKMDEGMPNVVASTVTTLSIRDSSGNGVHGTPRNIPAPIYKGGQLHYPKDY